MKRTIIFVIASMFSTFAFAFGCEWETFADYEVWCWERNIEPSYEEYEYYADKEGMCYYTDDEDAELDRLMSQALSEGENNEL